MTIMINTRENIGSQSSDQFLSQTLDLSVFVACYNEESNIIPTLDTLLSAFREVNCKWEIIIIDDASSDRSVELIQHYIREHPNCAIILKVNKINQGLPYNYIEAAFVGKGEYYRLVCGDNVEPKETFVALFNRLGESDILIPYQVECKGRTLFRRVLSKCFTWLVNLFSGYNIRYYNGLAVHRRYNVMRHQISYRGFGFQADLITRLLDLGASYTEVPVYAHERESGSSKAITLHNFISVALFFADLLFRRWQRVSQSKFKNQSIKLK